MAARVPASFSRAVRFDRILSSALANEIPSYPDHYIDCCAPEPAAAMEISRLTGCIGGDVLRLRGPIEHGDYRKFASISATRDASSDWIKAICWLQR